jgi:hypothetical protein
MEQESASRGQCGSPAIAGELYALDRGLPFGERLNSLARFQGGSWTVTRWLTHFAPPLLAEFALGAWLARPGDVPVTGTPFLLCLSREALRDGVRILVAEWMEFRRAAPDARLDLVIRAAQPESRRATFEFVSFYWDQVQALKRQLALSRSGAYLWLRAEDDEGDACLLDAAKALVIAARGESPVDPLALALHKRKPVLAARDAGLPCGYPFAFRARPARLRFVGERRRSDTASKPWPIPESLELARAIERLCAAGDRELADAARMLQGARADRSPAVSRRPISFAPPPPATGQPVCRRIAST